MQIKINNNKTLFQEYKNDVEVATRMYQIIKINHIFSFNEMFFMNPETNESRGSFNNLNKEVV